MKNIVLIVLLSGCWLLAKSQNNIQEVEYFFNSDPGFGNGIDVPISSAFTVTDLAFNADISSLPEGFNMLYVRALNDSGWSVAAVKPIFVFSTASVLIPNVTAVEFFIDADPGYGNGIDVPIADAATITDLNFAVSLNALSEGFHTLQVRALNENGKWSTAAFKPIYVFSASSISVSDITEVEYFLDADPGYGLANNVSITPSTSIADATFTIDLSSATSGFHTLNVRAKNANGKWSAASVKPIFIFSGSLAALPEITKLEYFFDDDPGYGLGVDVPITAANEVSNVTFDIIMDTLTQGFHVLNVRSQNQNGVWSIAYTKPIYVLSQASEPNIVALEYFFDTDPGVGSGVSIPVTPSVNIADLAVGATISALVVGPHLLYVRARDANGVWSTTESYPFEACIQEAPLAGAPLGLSYDTFVANWSSATSAVTYQLDVSTDTLQTFLSGFESKSLLVLRDTLTSLTPLTQYQYRVRALGPDNCLSINSDTVYVRTNSTLAIDTDALIAFYNQAGGVNWTNNNGWLSGLASNAWAGVTVVNENVVAVDLSNNNIKGPLPSDILNVSKLSTLNLSANEVDAVPDFSELPDLTSINLSDNRLDFGDLEYNLDVSGIDFSNQKAIGMPDNDTLTVGDAYTLNPVIGGSANQYQWTQNGNTLTGATTALYAIHSFAKKDQGAYECTITSPLIPSLTLKTAVKNLIGVASISGTLYAASNSPATIGTVQLLKITSGGYDSIPVVPLQINTDGSFSLDRILLDDYLLVGLADTNTYERALPTYVPGTAYWEEADTISLAENISGLEILTVLKPHDQLTGEGLLFGFVQEEDGTGGRTEKNSRVGGAGVSARRAQGTGRGLETFEIVAFVFTNEEGEFSIAGLPPGEYRFNVQYPGYPMDETTFIDFNIGTNALEETVQVEATVEGEKIKVRELIVTSVFESVDFTVEVFPNPSNGSISIKFETTDTNRTLFLKDANGKTLSKQSISNTKNQLSLSHLPAGIYLLHILTKKGLQKIVKVVKN